MADRPTEAECQRTIIEAAMTLGYRVHHSRPAQSGKGWRTPIAGHAGFPDLVIVGHRHAFFIELKRKPNKLDDAQQGWLDALQEAGLAAGVWWVPEEQQTLIDSLQRAAMRYP